MGNVETKTEERKPYPVENVGDNKDGKPVRLQSSHLVDFLVDDINDKNKDNTKGHASSNPSPKKPPAASSSEKASPDLAPESRGSKELSKLTQRFEKLLEEEIVIRDSVKRNPGAQGRGGICNVIGTSIINNDNINNKKDNNRQSARCPPIRMSALTPSRSPSWQ